MAYKITQHRRGTYEEWLNSNVVPYEGELIVVEFGSNIRKCKIGDGATCFSKLPYLTDWVVDALTDKIEALRELTNQDLEIALVNLSEKIEKLTAETTSKTVCIEANLNEQVVELSTKIDVLTDDLNKVDGIVKTLIEPATGALDAKYSEELTNLAEQHETDRKAIYQAINDKAGELIASNEAALTAQATETSTMLNIAKTELMNAYSADITSVTNAINQRIAETERAIKEQQAELPTKLAILANDVNEKIDTKIVVSEENTANSIAEIKAVLNKVNNDILQLQRQASTVNRSATLQTVTTSSIDSKELLTIIEQLEDLQYKIATLEANASATKIELQAIAGEFTRLSTSVTGLANQQKASLSSLMASLEALDTRLSKADADTKLVVASHIATINEELKKLTDADSLLYQVIYKIQDTLIKKIESVESSLRTELSNDIARVNTNIADTKVRLDAQFAQAQMSLNDSLTTAKTELARKIDNVEKLLGAKLEVNEATITALSTAVANGQATLSTLIENLTTDVINNTTSISNNTLAINRINTELDSKTAILSTGLDAANAKIDNQINAVENKLQTKVAAAENSLHAQAEALTALQDEFEDLLEELDTRIADKVLDNNTETKANITALRNAINQLKTDIEKYKESSSTGGSNADIITSINRINDEITDLAADDVVLYQVIYRIRDTLLKNISDLRADLQSNLNGTSVLLDQAFAELQSKLETTLTTSCGELSERVSLLDDKIISKADTLERVIFGKTAENANTINALAAEINNNNTNIRNELKTLSTEITANKNNITANAWSVTQVGQDLDNKTKRIDADIDLLDGRLDAQEKRISNIIALENGSTTGDAELLDIRTGYNGEVHASAGDAVRSLGTGLQSLRNSLSQYIDTQAIDGLHYDYSGEVGLRQPYMLYLTAGDEIIPDSGVQIISGSGGGSGGSSMSSLKIGYITQSPIIVTPTDRAMIYFTFSGVDSSGDAVMQAAAAWKVNGVTVANSVVKDGENEFDATKYIKTGTTKLLLTVTDDNGSVVTKSWAVQQIELTLDSKFNDKRKYTAGESIIFDYIPFGAIEKTAIFKLNGKEIGRTQLGKEVSGTTVSYELPAQKHGSYLLDVYLEAEINGELVPSNHIQKDILWYDAASSTPIIGIANTSITVKQYSTTNIIFTVYDPKNETPTVDIEVDGSIVTTSVVKPNKDYGNTPTDIYSYIAAYPGTHTIKLICGSTKKVINIYVEDIGVNISPVTTGLAFDFNPAGKSNSDGNNIWSYNNIHMTVSDNFDWVNGGYIPNEVDGPCFCIKAGSSATIDYKLFADEAKATGKEFKLIFKTKNVSNPDAIFLSCIDNTTSKDHIGLTMGVHNANIYGKNGSLELAYSEEDTIEFEFNISRDTEAIPMVMGYEDGVPSRPMVYDSTYSFKQNTPKVITLGSTDCDLYIYRFKVYNTSLSASSILNNFIADARTADEMIARYTRNQIYDENQKLTAEVLAEKCPWLRVYKISAPHFTSSKSDKVSDTTIQQIYHGGDPILDNWVAHNSKHSGQGTSSNNYGAAGRNLDFIMNDDTSYFELGDGTIADKITLTRTSIPVAYLNAKVNIASSNNLTNPILAERYNRFNPYRRPFVRDDGTNTDYIKDTMEFYNCVIFIQETDPDLATHREFADNDWHFYAIGNIGDSKKTDKTRLTDQNDPYECCVEIMDVDLPLSAFPRDTMINAMGFAVNDKGERIYTWAKDSNLGILYEKQEDGTYTLTTDTQVNFDKTYYVDILEQDDFSEDFTYGWRYLSNKKDEDIVRTCKQAWIDFYRFVTTSTDEEFKANLGNYFVVDSALYYYLFTTRYCMVDNRAKNTFWHYSKTIDGTRKWDLCWDYDNDTSLGLNNFGKQLYRYGLEDIDCDDAGEEVFRQSDSLFFCRIRDLFATELKQMYQTLESKDAWNADVLLNECDTWQEQFPEELWRIDIDRKYIRTYNSSFINGQGDKQFLTNMANGRMKYHRRQWERSQEQYMASKYQTTTAMSESYHANFRVNRPDAAGLVIPPNYQFTLTPYSYIYLNVYYNSGTPISVRAEPNVPTTVPYFSDFADIINIGSASAIMDFGDLAPLYADTVSVSNATRVKKLKIGDSTEGYRNANFSSLTTGANGLLEELDITNISSFSQTLDLKKLINLKKLQAFGTSIPSVIFADGGKINYIELPAVNDITINNLKYLSTDNIKLASYNNVVDLTITGCPLVNQFSIFELCTSLNRAKLDNIDFGTKTYEYFESNVFKLKGIDANVPNAQITGTVHFEQLTGAQFNELKSRYPQLTITYDTLTSVITFKDTDNESTIYIGTILNAADCEDPTTAEGWVSPIKEIIPEFTYDWFGWSEIPNTVINYEHLSAEEAAAAEQADYYQYRVLCLKRVEGDRTLYPVFKVTRNCYEVQFINPTDNNKVLYSVMVPYGSDAAYIGETPKKLDAATTSLYSFLGWAPSPLNITGNTVCFAQFAILDSTWYTINLLDITDCEDYQGNIFDGYQLNNNNTMAITACKNKLNKAVKIPAQLVVDGNTYTITTVGGFNDHDNIELLSLPTSLLEIASRAFYSCNYLMNVDIPENVVAIGASAFQGCTNLTEITIPRDVSSVGEAAFAECSRLARFILDTNNKYYIVLQDGQLLIDLNGKLIQGLSGGKLTNDLSSKISSLGSYCFAGTSITSAEIPEGITVIPPNAFSHCESLTELTLPSTLVKLDATCFAWCKNLANVMLKPGLLDISTYVFNSCSLETIEIPSTVNYVRAQSFGSIKTLKTVTFKKRLNSDGTVFVPEISENAFAGSGTASAPVVFRVPWSEGQTPLAPWGATNATIIYNYEEA